MSLRQLAFLMLDVEKSYSEDERKRLNRLGRRSRPGAGTHSFDMAADPMCLLGIPHAGTSNSAPCGQSTLNCVLIDYQIKGWAQSNKEKIGKTYSEIRYVGDPQNPGAGSSDSALASFCAENGCHLLTSDKKAYTPWLEQGVKEVRISLFDKEQFVYLVRAA